MRGKTIINKILGQVEESAEPARKVETECENSDAIVEHLFEEWYVIVSGAADPPKEPAHNAFQ